MPKIEFLSNLGAMGKALPGKTVDVPEGGALVDICDEHFAPVPFSCRSASCATCEIEIIEGADLLLAPEPEEQDLLDVLNSPPTHRLACQAVVKPGAGVLRLRALS